MPGGQTLEIKVFGDVQFSRTIDLTGRRARRMRPVFDQIGHNLADIMTEQFQTSGARGQGGWAPLKPTTIESKRAHGSPTPERPLEDTGRGRESFRYGDSLNIFEATDDYLHYGSMADWLAYHQPDPQDRRVFELTDRDRRDIVSDMQVWIVTGELKS